MTIEQQKKKKRMTIKPKKENWITEKVLDKAGDLQNNKVHVLN